MISSVPEISLKCQGSNVSCSFCYAMSFPLADPLSWETIIFRYILPFRAFLTVFEVVHLCETLGRNCAVAKKHSRSPSGKIPANSALLPDQSQTIVHDGSSCGRWACPSRRGSDPMAIRVRSTLLFCLRLFRNLWHKSSRFY